MEPNLPNQINQPIQNTVSAVSSQLKDSKKSYIKLIFIVLGVIVAGEIVWALYSLLNTNNQSSTSQPPVSTQTANSQANTLAKSNILSLKSDKTSFQVGKTFDVSINVSTNTPSEGTDVIIDYDPDILEVIPTGGKAVKVTNIYEEYPLNTVDAKTGRISISGITNKTNGVLVNGQIGTIEFKAKAKGQSSIAVEFKKDSTTDSNIITPSSAKDVLESVENINVSVQ